MKGLSTSYADFILRTRYDQLKPEVVLQAKKLILDLVGVSLAGYKLMEFPRLVVSYMESLGGNPEAFIFQTVSCGECCICQCSMCSRLRYG